MRAPDRLTLALAAPAAHHDALLLGAVASVSAELGRSPSLRAFWFERTNKPDWGLRLHAVGDGRWLEDVARSVLESTFRGLDPEAGVREFTFVPEEPDDKWVGGRADVRYLAPIHHADTVACLDLLAAEARGSLRHSRAEYSLALVERLLDRLELDRPSRMEFHRQGYRWAIDSGRWQADVIALLEERYRAQRERLLAAVDRRVESDDEPWGGEEAGRIARRLLEDVRAPLRAVMDAHRRGETSRDPVSLAVLIAHAHSNRLGIFATQEAVMRYLVWRALGEGGEPDP